MKTMLRNITMFLAVVNMAMACNGRHHEDSTMTNVVVPKPSQISVAAISEAWTELTASDQFIITMPYADTSNFTHKKIYNCARCLLRPEVAEALILANKTAIGKGLKIVIYDAYRPLPYQQKMYDVVPDKRYVADPAKGSMHNRGCAVDVSLADSPGNLLDMGTGFDDFSEKAAYSFSGLTAEQKNNRSKLLKIMTGAGFKPYENEWWHFTYKRNDYPLSDYVWPCN